jgi:pilus assembly protein CpaC
VRPVSNGVLLSGFVDRPGDADRIKQLAEEYYPKVINNITVAGVQQVLLHIKVYEVSRTKLRNLGFDFAQLSATGGFVTSSISQILAGGGSTAVAGPSTFAFQAVSGGSSFFGILNALREDNLAKVLSEPTLVTQSGRPAYFRVGGEIPYSVSQGLGAVSIEWKNYGTRVDFVPFVLGNGKIRLEVRPQVSEVDNTRSTVAGVPAIKVRETDTGVELEAGQTLAIAGLVQTRVEAQNRGLPWVSEVPYVGALFRRVREENNDIETLILVSPEIVDGMDPHEVPPCPPGTNGGLPCGHVAGGGAALPARDELDKPRRLATLHAGQDRSAQRLPHKRRGKLRARCFAG